MTIAALRSALPDWAKDLSLNLSTLTRSTTLSEQQQWGALLAAAAATRNESVLAHVAEDAGEHLSEQARSAALGAAKIDFELWSLTVSAINGCQACVTAHSATVRAEGLSTEQVWEAVRIAATIQGVAQAVSIVETVS